jgi:hypothetical protein
MKRILHILFVAAALALMGLAVYSGRCQITYSSAVTSKSSQWHINVRYGTIRWLRGELDTLASGSDAGWSRACHGYWSFDWWFSIVLDGPLRLFQVPIWALVLPILIGRWLLRWSLSRSTTAVAKLSP